MTDTERFRTERLVARSWQIEDLPLARELWGDPAITALIDSRGKLNDALVEEKLRAEIERERLHGVQYWALFDHRNGGFVGCGGLRSWVYTPGEPNFEVGFHLVKSCWGIGLATEAARGVLEYAWHRSRLSKVYAGHHPDNRASREAWVRVYWNRALRANGVDAPVLRPREARTGGALSCEAVAQEVA